MNHDEIIKHLLDHSPNLPWLKDSCIFFTKHGSHAYGTNTPESDLDIRGIVIPPKEYFLGFVNQFEQVSTSGKSTDPDVPDLVAFDIVKFFRLAMYEFSSRYADV